MFPVLKSLCISSLMSILWIYLVFKALKTLSGKAADLTCGFCRSTKNRKCNFILSHFSCTTYPDRNIAVHAFYRQFQKNSPTTVSALMALNYRCYQIEFPKHPHSRACPQKFSYLLHYSVYTAVVSQEEIQNKQPIRKSETASFLKHGSKEGGMPPSESTTLVSSSTVKNFRVLQGCQG